MLRWLKTVVVSDEEKAPVRRQVGAGKTITAEVSKLQDDVETGVWCKSRDKPGGSPPTGRAASGAEVT
ncbi:hypothetical protein, partial [Streptomyces chiangmaiensis]